MLNSWLIALVVWLGGCCLAQIYPITPQPSINLVNSSLRPVEMELVDQIESIEVTATQVVISTSKMGPPESMKVSIGVVDVETGQELPSSNLTGILLLLTRGRYTISFLTPNRWYGIRFRCEQQYGGPAGVIYVNQEEHLVKTHKEDGSNLDTQPLVTVSIKRFGTGGRSLENLIITVRWQQHPDERKSLDAITNVTLYCKEQIKYKQLKLYGREMEKSVEVKLDNHFEIMEFYNTSRQIIASITPKNCPRICWNTELVAETSQGFHFRRAATHNCEEIGAVSASTSLRDYLSYEAHSNKLVVHTNYSDEEHQNKEPDAYIQVTAIPLPESKKPDNTTVRFKTYSTSKNENDFIVDHLEPNKMYAVQYTYGKQSPFAYAESRRFIVHTKSEDGSAGQSPLKLIMEQFSTSPDPPVNTSSHANSTAHTFTATPPTPPKLIMRLDPQFKNYEVGVDVEPFCNLTPTNGSHFWLSKDKPSKELRDLNVVDALCDQTTSLIFCDKPTDNNSAVERRRKCSLGSALCYTTNIVVQEKIYSMDRKCVDVPKYYHPLQPSTSTPAGNSAAQVCFNKLYLIALVLLFVFC